METLINKQISFPVGRVEYLAVRPFSFNEFIYANGEKNIIDAINERIIPDYAHERLIGLFKMYALIGGMPEIIRTYLGTKDLTKIKRLIGNLKR